MSLVHHSGGDTVLGQRIFCAQVLHSVVCVLYIAVGTTLSDRAACQEKRLPNPFGLPFVAEPWLIRKDVLQELLPLNFIFRFGYTI